MDDRRPHAVGFGAHPDPDRLLARRWLVTALAIVLALIIGFVLGRLVG